MIDQKRAQELVSKHPRLLLISPRRTGKTELLAQLARQYTVMYSGLTLRQSREFRERVGDDIQWFAWNTEVIKCANLLCLDDAFFYLDLSHIVAQCLTHAPTTPILIVTETPSANDADEDDNRDMHLRESEMSEYLVSEGFVIMDAPLLQ
jgi:hypothetical protein